VELPDGRFATDDDRIFLLPEEVLAAVREDFAQYPPQRLLLTNLAALLLGPGQTVADRNDRGVWIRVGRRGKMRLVEHRQLAEMICEAMASDLPPLPRLAVICRMVFHERAEAGQVDGADGIWVETGMKGFSCLRCGHCCLNVGYPREAEEEDVQEWKAAGRDDILRWVGIERQFGSQRSYRIWIDPVSGRPADRCPWLVRVPGSHLSGCAIQEVKPDICRLYPGSRKHASMTGCRGFERLG
jgi:Fe-S-cluster containining protein